MAQNCNMIFLFDSKLQCKHYANYRNNSSLLELKLIFLPFLCFKIYFNLFCSWQAKHLSSNMATTTIRIHTNENSHKILWLQYYNITKHKNLHSNFLSYLKIRSYPSMSLRSASALTLAGRGASLVFGWIALQVFMLFLVKCYDNKMVKLPYNLIYDMKHSSIEVN